MMHTVYYAAKIIHTCSISKSFGRLLIYRLDYERGEVVGMEINM